MNLRDQDWDDYGGCSWWYWFNHESLREYHRPRPWEISNIPEKTSVTPTTVRRHTMHTMLKALAFLLIGIGSYITLSSILEQRRVLREVCLSFGSIDVSHATPRTSGSITYWYAPAPSSPTEGTCMTRLDGDIWCYVAGQWLTTIHTPVIPELEYRWIPPTRWERIYYRIKHKWQHFLLSTTECNFPSDFGIKLK